MEKFLKIILGIFFSITGLIVIIFGSLALMLFFNPIFIVNPKNINYALKKTSFLKSWSWKKGEINHQWISWNHRYFSGHFQDLCLSYENIDIALDTCMEEVSWNLDLKWMPGKGFIYTIDRPLIIDSRKTKLTLFDNTEDSPAKDYLSYWNMIWKKIIPNLDFSFREVDIIKPRSHFTFDLKLMKSPKVLNVWAMGYELIGTEKEITIIAPRKILLSVNLKTKIPLYFQELKLVGHITDNSIPILITGSIDSAKLKVTTKISHELLKSKIILPHFLKQILLPAHGILIIEKVKATLGKLLKPPYNILPAPLNALEGSFKMNVKVEDIEGADNVLFKIIASLDLVGVKQVINLDLKTEVPFNLKTKEISSITLGVDMKKVSILLPKLAKNRMPPQLKPDPRFKLPEVIVVNKSHRKKKKIDFKLHLQALGDKALFIKTNLLDEILRLKFYLEIEDGTTKGFVHALPLKTTIFKRPIIFQSVKIVFNNSLVPELTALIEFHLPQYLITLNLEGPITKPRQAFRSSPPLSQDDIYAVLLFGQPLSGLGTDDKTAAKSAGQILSQGILSLAVLYYFAGSPVQSLGYDPESKALAAQIGLGAKNSLRVSTESGGLNSAGVRRSLGKGWYIDSSVQKSTGSFSSATDYGVLLERIISY
ncbi:MAG: translocation/assembly module TamB domain-containing protein [Bacteriovorax sp.]|nr:translocation/assembly module TamB domain-containing protein [Bacteriovorax sp.]